MKDDYLFFWGHTPAKAGYIDKSCLSQWYPASFTINGITYATAEHYMMAQKANLFDDFDVFKLMVESVDPKEVKEMGRAVKNYDDAIWVKHREQVVFDGNLAKFSQHKDLKDFLISTENRRLVEASPLDNIWGVGLAAHDPRIFDSRSWKGLNLLGKVLEEVRSRITKESLTN